MRLAVFLAAGMLAFAQTPDPAYEPLTRAYQALRARNYAAAVTGFLQAIEAAPARAAIRKDLAYAYLKIGQNEDARNQFHEAMRLDPADDQVAMEYAFLCNESRQQGEARRIFDRIRKKSNPVAEQAFQNIDQPLAAGIARWQSAIAMGSDNFSSHYELATLAEQRDEFSLAAEHYQKAWLILPDRRSVLVDLARAWQAFGRTDDATAALLAASRGGEPRAAEMARERLPKRYPYVSEFRRALALDPSNVELRRELAYLLLKMGRQAEAEKEFGVLTRNTSDLLSATQLGFLEYARGDSADAMPLFRRVLDGSDEDLANRVRAVLRQQQMTKAPPAIGAREMAERSIKAGYLKDGLKYLETAHEADPGDFNIAYKLGWINNLLHQDAAAARWFYLARRSPDPRMAADAARSWRNLRGEVERIRVSAWFYPLYSSRWHDVFGYAQMKTEIRTEIPLIPYVSVRFVGDTRVRIGVGQPPMYLSESAAIVGVGVRTIPSHGVMGWFEAGSAMSYETGHMLPDYRGGVSISRGLGHLMGGESNGLFADTTFDGVFVSRFGNDVLGYSQSRVGLTTGPEFARTQVYWNGNLTFDSQRQSWANFFETGPGVRVHQSWMPGSMYVTFNVLQGIYLDGPGRMRFTDLRIGLWYAFSR
jgi:Flp pilus assembly protein TadD